MGGKTTVWIGIVLALLTAILLGWNSYRLEKAQYATAYLRLSPDLAIGQGSTVPAEALQTVRLPETARTLASTAIADTRENREWLRDRRASKDIANGSILLYQDFGDDPTSRFAASITTGHRAVSIEVDSASAVSYLVEPGSRVDVLGLFEETVALPRGAPQEMSAAMPRRAASKTILQNVRVLAVGGASTRGAYANSSDGSGLGTVTLELTPEQAELLVFAQGSLRNSQLLLALRNPTDTAQNVIADRTWEEAVPAGQRAP